MEINELLHKEIERNFNIRRQQEDAYLKLTNNLRCWGIANLNSLQFNAMIDILQENLNEFYK